MNTKEWIVRYVPELNMYVRYNLYDIAYMIWPISYEVVAIQYIGYYSYASDSDFGGMDTD